MHALLARDLVASLATIDSEGFPHVTPVWFAWLEDAFWITSFDDRPHVMRLRRNPRAGICVESEMLEREDGERPNRQVRAVGLVELAPDVGGRRTRQVHGRYVRGAGAGSATRGPRPKGAS